MHTSTKQTELALRNMHKRASSNGQFLQVTLHSVCGTKEGNGWRCTHYIDQWETPDKRSPLAPVAKHYTSQTRPLCSFCIPCTHINSTVIKPTGSTCFCKNSSRTAEAWKASLSFDRILSRPHVYQRTSLHLLLQSTLSFSSPQTGAGLDGLGPAWKTLRDSWQNCHPGQCCIWKFIICMCS